MATKTFMATKQNHTPKWHVIDASGQILGRVAAQAASILRGKHSPRFTPNADCGDYVIIINCAKAVLSGNKLQQKEYIRHTGWIGGLKRVKYVDLMATRPEFAMKMAVEGMLPHTTLGREQLTHLRVFAGAEHEHEAQVNASTSTAKKTEKKEKVKKGGIKKEKPVIKAEAPSPTVEKKAEASALQASQADNAELSQAERPNENAESSASPELAPETETTADVATPEVAPEVEETPVAEETATVDNASTDEEVKPEEGENNG